jgi:uncharacterized protein YmfQ (DUF2313 family)
MTTSSSPHGELLANLLPLDTAQSHAKRMANAATPILSDEELLDDWERVYGLPPCPRAPKAQRVARLLGKINMQPGDQSKATYIKLAALFGYSITITNRQPFIVGYGQSQVGITPLAGAWIRYVWDVHGLPTPAPIAACGLGLGSGQLFDYFRVNIHRVGVHPMLISYTGDTVQDLFEWIKPAHTQVIFN